VLASRDLLGPRIDSTRVLAQRRLPCRQVPRLYLEVARAGLHGREQGVEGPLGVGHRPLRHVEHVGGDPEATRDGEPVGATGDALQQAIGRRQRLGLELQ